MHAGRAVLTAAPAHESSHPTDPAPLSARLDVRDAALKEGDIS